MRKKIGFIGAGNMGSAMIKGIIAYGLASKDEVIASCHTQETKEKLSSELGIEMTLDNKEAADAEIVFFAVKPAVLPGVAAEVKDVLNTEQLIISVAAGFDLKKLHAILGDELHIVRTMPNTPALVGEGITGVCKNELVTEEEFTYVLKLLSSFGLAEAIPESLMDAVVSVSGSSPAYVFLFIEAMADAAVADGMPRAQAYKFAAQAVLGSAKMVLETGKHPGELKDMVCSPAGTTIEAVRVLEKEGLRSSVMECMKACADKSRNM